MGTIPEDGFSKSCAWIMFSLGNVLVLLEDGVKQDWKHTSPLLGQIAG